MPRLAPAGVCFALLTALAPSVSAEPSTAAAPSVRISAQVDKTTLDVGGQLTLTLTIDGDLERVELKPVEFPKPFQVLVQRRASNISMQQGQISKSVSLTYVLVPVEAGTFRLGPFELTAPGGQAVQTDPVEIVVNKPVLPPSLKPSQRFIL